MGHPLRYVIQRHEREPDPHFDIMLERGDALKTFSSPELPRSGPPIEVHALPDHRLDYLEYEGEISGGRGSCSIRDRGTYLVSIWGDDRIVVHLEGGILRGTISLDRIDGERWGLCFEDSAIPGLPAGGGSEA